MAHQRDTLCVSHPITGSRPRYHAGRLGRSFQHHLPSPSTFDRLRYQGVRRIDRVLFSGVQQIHDDRHQQTYRVVGISLDKEQMLQAQAALASRMQPLTDGMIAVPDNDIYRVHCTNDTIVQPSNNKVLVEGAPSQANPNSS